MNNLARGSGRLLNSSSVSGTSLLTEFEQLAETLAEYRALIP
jgi:hypothetical protein